MTQQHIHISRKMAINLGICGILGSLVLFAGDMLFYYANDSTDFILNMGNASSERIIASGICALFSAWLYTLASGQVYYALQPTKKWLRLLTFFSFAAVMITYGVVHGAYIAIATSAKNAVQLGMAPNTFTELAIQANDALRLIAYIPFGIFTILFIPLVWMEQTKYPKWIILFSPVIPFLLNNTIVNSLEGEWKTIIGGGYLNLILTLFFSATTFSLWRAKENSSHNRS